MLIDLMDGNKLYLPANVIWRTHVAQDNATRYILRIVGCGVDYSVFSGSKPDCEQVREAVADAFMHNESRFEIGVWWSNARVKEEA